MDAIALCCPVCEGRQVVEPGFYHDADPAEVVTCRSCAGQGFVIHVQVDERGGAAVPSDAEIEQEAAQMQRARNAS